jgi:hypothetical protein
MQQQQEDQRRSAAARRMREARERRLLGYRCVAIELHDRDIAGLVRAGLLAAAEQNNREAVARAMGEALDALPRADGATVFPMRPSN